MNNYNQSDTGINIELSVYFDNDASQRNFDESFSRITGDTWWYTFFGEIEAPSGFDDLFTLGTIPTETIFEILHECHGYNSTGLEEYFESNDEALTELLGNYSFPEDLSDFVEMLEDYDIEHTRSFERTTSRGNCQGDLIEVFISTSIRELYGLTDDIDLVNHLQLDIDNLVWEAPISCRIEINGEEYVSEFFDGMYENCFYPANKRTSSNHFVWDKDVFIDEVVAVFLEFNEQTLREELNSIVLNELEYE